MPPRFELNSIGLWLWNLFVAFSKLSWVECGARSESKWGIIIKWCKKCAKEKEEKSCLPLNRRNLMVDYTRKCDSASHFNVNLCWANNFRKFHWMSVREKQRKLRCCNELFVEEVFSTSRMPFTHWVKHVNQTDDDWKFKIIQNVLSWSQTNSFKIARKVFSKEFSRNIFSQTWN